jgi:hypothetical protein
VLVLRTQFGFEVRNLSWWHRMKVNGWAFEQAPLESGDVIEVGGLRLTFLDELVSQTSRSARPGGSESVDARAS